MNAQAVGNGRNIIVIMGSLCDDAVKAATIIIIVCGEVKFN